MRGMEPAPDRTRLSSGGLLFRNTLFNLGGQGGTIVLALISVPILLHGLGVDRFGILALAWATIAYAGRLDLGLGRSLTRSVAIRLGTGREDEVPAVFWAAVGTALAMGVIVGVILAAISPWLARDVLSVPVGLEDEAIGAFRVLALSVPVVVSGTAIRGYLEAHQRFDLTNAILVPATMLSYLGPLAVLQFTTSLPAVISTVVVSRLLAAAAALVMCVRITPALRHPASGPGVLGELVRTGGWIMGTNLVVPLLSSTMDRFFIGAMLSTAAVAYYATPFEAISRLAIVPAAFAGVMFPAFSLTTASDPRRASALFVRGSRLLLTAMFPPVLIAVTLASPLMTLWLGSTVAEQSTPILQWLAIGILVNALAVPTFGLVQTMRPALIAGVQFAELPFYAAGLWLSLKLFGLTGAAVAWTLRASLDSLILFSLAGRLLPETAEPSRRLWAILVPTMGVLLACGQLDGLAEQLACVTVGLAAFSLIASRWLLHDEDRSFARRLLPRSRSLA
jgi:O-antigen/teichoic acid export membrane protein